MSGPSQNVGVPLSPFNATPLKPHLNVISPIYHLPAPPVIVVPGSASTTGAEPPVSLLNKVRKQKPQQQATVAAIGSLLAVYYGPQSVGAKISAVVVKNSALILRCIWGQGEIDAVESYTINDLPPVGTTATHYTGTLTQLPDPTLVDAYARKGIIYSDALPGVAYSVISVQPSKNAGYPRITAVIRGMKVSLVSGGAKTYSTNPAFAIADFIENNVYGMGGAVDWSSVAVVAAAADAMIGTPSEKRRMVGLALDSLQPAATWLNVLRDYANCFVVPEGGVYRLILDAPSSSVKSFDTSNIVAGSFSWTKNGNKSSATVVQVTYTDTSTKPWGNGVVTLYAPGVLAGTTPFRMTGIQKPGIQRYSEAYRYAVERLNGYLLNDVSVSFTAFDEALAVQVGDIITVSHPDGFVNKLFWATKIDPKDPGRWALVANEFDPAKYSDVVVSGPSVVDTTLPDPTTVPGITGLVAEEDVYQVNTGLFGSRIAASWDPVSWPFLAGYLVTVSADGAVVEGPAVVTDSTYVSKQVTEGLVYTITVQAASQLSGIYGLPASLSFTALGKLLKPSDVPFFDGIVASGETRLRWVPAVDLDLRAHELRYGAVGAAWEAMTLIDRISMPTLTYTTRAVPAGLWDFAIKGLDSVRTDTYPFGQESVNMRVKTLLVDDDPNLFVSTDYPWQVANLTNMAVVPGGWITQFAGDTWNSLFPLAMSTYTNPLASYHTAGTSSLVSESLDFGGIRSGTYTLTPPTYVDLSGAAALYTEVSLDGTTWVQYLGSVATAQARYVRMRLETTGSMLVSDEGSVQLAVTTQSETGEVTSSASGPVTVTLARKYAQTKTIQLTAQTEVDGVRNPCFLNLLISNDARYCAIGIVPEDYVDESFSPTNTFDVESFNALGVLAVSTVKYLYEGVVA